MRLIERLSADAVCLKGALRALRMTTPIAKNPTRVFPPSSTNSPKNTATRRRCSPTARASPTRARARSNRYARWALEQGIAQGRHGLPADAEPAGIHGDLARHHPRRRRGGAAQHQSRPAPRSPIASTSSRPSTSSWRPSCSHALETRAAAPHRRRRRSGCTARPTADFPRIDREIERCPATISRHRERRAADHRGSRALHLHLRHHRAAQGRQHQPLPA